MVFEELMVKFAQDMARKVADRFQSDLEVEVAARAAAILKSSNGNPSKRNRRKVNSAFVIPGPNFDLAATKKKSPLAGRKKNMACRVASCRNRSKGPRFGYMCEKHLKLPRKTQQRARMWWNQKHAS